MCIEDLTCVTFSSICEEKNQNPGVYVFTISVSGQHHLHFLRKRLGDHDLLVDESQKYILNLFFLTGHQPNIPVQ